MTDEPLSDKDGRPRGHDRELREFEVKFWDQREGDGLSRVTTARYWAHTTHHDKEEGGLYQLVRYAPGDVPYPSFEIRSECFINADAVEHRATEDNQTQHGPHSNTTDDVPTPQDVPF